jgi:hypothetical protein
MGGIEHGKRNLTLLAMARIAEALEVNLPSRRLLLASATLRYVVRLCPAHVSATIRSLIISNFDDLGVQGLGDRLFGWRGAGGEVAAFDGESAGRTHAGLAGSDIVRKSSTKFYASSHLG